MKKSRKKGRKRKNKITIGKVIAGTIIVLTVVAGCVYGTVAYSYQDRLFLGTEINNIDCSNLTVEQAEQKIREKVESYSIELQFKEGKTESISGADIDYEYVSSGEISEIKKSQVPLKWIVGYFKKDIHEVGENIEFDAQKLNQKLSAMECMQSENMVEPENAYIDFKANEFVIVEEKEGTVVDKTMLLPLLEDAIHKSETKLSVQDAGAYKTATVKKDDKDLAAKQKMWNDHARATIVYTFGDQVEPVTGMAIKEWLAYDEKGNYVDDPAILRANVENFVRLLAEKYDTVGKERTIVGTATGQEITVTGGSYGYKIDQKAEVEQLLSEITSHANIEREPVYTQTEKTREGNGLGDTYVEIDMTAQHLWFYKNGTIIVESNIVTGTYVVPDRRTPGGTYYLYYKQKDQVLRGKKLEDGTYEYESPVSYWMPFNRGIGLHDASWRYGNFGGSIYMTSGSHGCVNLPPSAAAQIYENIEAGCPIICYYR